jgi:hypothetical protein
MSKALGFVLLGVLAGCSGSSGGQQPVYGPGPDNEGTPAAQRSMTAEQYEEIERVRRVGMPGLNGCYEDELERRNTKKLKGKLTVKIQIGTQGSALQVNIAQTTFNAPVMHQCIQQQIMKWEFPRLQSPTWYGTTIEFSPAY